MGPGEIFDNMIRAKRSSPSYPPVPLRLPLWAVNSKRRHRTWKAKVAQGKIKRLTDRGFGFIETGEGNDLFFHMSSLLKGEWDDLREGQEVNFEVGQGDKGPRAEKVMVTA